MNFIRQGHLDFVALRVVMLEARRKVNASPLSAAQKILCLRKSMGITQVQLNEVIGGGLQKIADAERGKFDYAPDQIEAARSLLGIEGMPLTEYEREVFRERIYHMRKCIRLDKLDDAKALRDEMANIVKLDICDDYLPMLFKITEILLIIYEDDLVTAEEQLNEGKDAFFKAGAELQYYYNHYMCYILIRNHKPEDAIIFCKAAIELGEKAEDFTPDNMIVAYSYIGMYYSRLEYPYMAIRAVEKVMLTHSENEFTDIHLNLDLLLALNYIRVDNLDEAKSMLDKCLVKAEGIKNKNTIGHVLLIFGLLHKKTEDWKTAISYLDKAQKCFSKGSSEYFQAVYRKIYCIIELRAFSKAMEALNRIAPMYNTNKVYATYFEALKHYLTIMRRISTANKESVDYILNIAIPHLIKQRHEYFIAIEYYELLKTHFLRVKNKSGAALMEKHILEIYKRCLLYPKGGS